MSEQHQLLNSALYKDVHDVFQPLASEHLSAAKSSKVSASAAAAEVSHGDLAKPTRDYMPVTTGLTLSSGPRYTVIFSVAAPNDPIGNATLLSRPFRVAAYPKTLQKL